ISSAGGRLRSLIDDLLAYARSGNEIGAVVSVDLESIVQNVLESLNADLKASDASVDIDPLPVVNADPISIGQIFQNLISNAVKYRADRPPVIHIKARDEGKAWRFEVEDN